MYILLHSLVHSSACVHVGLWIYIYTCVYTHTHTHSCDMARTHTHSRDIAGTQARTHTHTHTHTRAIWSTNMLLIQQRKLYFWSYMTNITEQAIWWKINIKSTYTHETKNLIRNLFLCLHKNSKSVPRYTGTVLPWTLKKGLAPKVLLLGFS